jgi:argininosuccinate lyase
LTLWDKGKETDLDVLAFAVGDDYLLDKRLVRFDCVASMAHARTLHKAGLLTHEELEKLLQCLGEIMENDVKGIFLIKPEDEDCHTAIENYLTQKLGDAGKKIHTGRSRNDQVVAALKLYMKSELAEVKSLISGLKDALLALSKSEALLPGYSHMRKAMPSSVKLWAEGFRDSLQADLLMIDAALSFIDSCPLGSAAGYGVNLPLDREFTSKLLGFSKVQGVTAVQVSRGKDEAMVISALMPIMLDLNKMAADMILFSMPELGYFLLPDAYCTGSSIMPHKKNPDALELVRGKSKLVQSHLQSCLSIIQDLPSGYNRDFQLTKKPLMESIDITKQSLKVMSKFIRGLRIDKAACLKAMTPELYAADEAYELVKKGMPFRDAYKEVGKKY